MSNGGGYLLDMLSGPIIAYIDRNLVILHGGLKTEPAEQHQFIYQLKPSQNAIIVAAIFTLVHI